MLTQRKYNILAINWQDIRNPLGGGAEVHFHEIFKRVAALGHSVTLLCCRFPGALPDEELDGIRIVRRGGRSWFNLVVPMAYAALARRHRYDIVIDDLNKIPFFTPLYVKEPLLALIHHFFGRSIYLQTNRLAAGYVYYSEKLVPHVYRRTPFAAVSNSTALELSAAGHQSWIELLPNAVDGNAYRPDPAGRSQEPLIGYLGRLKKYKSVDHLLHAFAVVLAKEPRARLLIIGDGDDRDRLQKAGRDLGLADRITFTGHVTQEEKNRYLNQLWLAVNPSPKEGWGLTVIEANACGVPVVAADVPGLRDSVVHERTGLLYPYGDTTAMTAAIHSLLANNERRRLMGEEALAWAAEFTWERSAQKAVEIIDRAITQ